MVRVGKGEMGFIGHLFENWDETMIWSCLQGVMGEAWADSLPDARSAQIVTGDFCFLAGAPDGELVGNIPASFPSRSILMASRDEGWGELIEACYGDRCVKFRRYALKKEKGVFERDVLESYVGRLPEGYVIRPIDGELYRRILSEEWSHDLCSQFRDEGHFMQMGVGFVALWGEEIAGGASSYTVYREGIEIEIDVKEAHRRKGVARACAARLILECLDRGIYPSWMPRIRNPFIWRKLLGIILMGLMLLMRFLFVRRQKNGILERQRRIRMYENHHIFGAEMAGDFLREFGYDKTKLELVQKCILNHRDSKVMEKQSPEEIYVADADSISHFDAVPSLFYLAYVQRKLGIDDGIDFVKNKLNHSYQKLSERGKEIYKDKYEQVISLLV